jgi:hypothetical protein
MRLQTHSETRTLESCPSVIFITYTPGPGERERGYEKWLREVDNPFFNGIPGIRHYANWQIERVLAGAPLGYAYFDFLGLEAASDLERVWFNSDLDRFRKEWVRLWGYEGAVPGPLFAYAFLMRPVQSSGRQGTRFARISGGTGRAPAGFDLAWQVEETVHKHFTGRSEGPWRQSVATLNPLGLDWIGLTYREGGDGGPEPAEAERVAYTARLLASPDGTAG